MVTVAALPLVEPEEPVIDPVIGLVTVKLAKVPTLVKEEAVTPEFRVAPLKVLAAAVTVIGAEPSKLTPLMARAVASTVAVAALPVVEPEEPVTEPVMGFVTVRLTSVPTEVKEEAVTPEFKVAPVKVPAADVIVILPVPSKEVPLIVRAVCRAVAVPAFPETEVWSPVLVPEDVPEKVPLWVAKVPRPRLVRAVEALVRSDRLADLTARPDRS